LEVEDCAGVGVSPCEVFQDVYVGVELAELDGGLVGSRGGHF
jgi:hypothetical protein